MIKSQDELIEEGRDSEVLIKAIEKCEFLEGQNVDLYVDKVRLEEKCEKLEKQLTYAIQALEMYEIQQDFTPEDYHYFAKDTLKEIKELDK